MHRLNWGCQLHNPALQILELTAKTLPSSKASSGSHCLHGLAPSNFYFQPVRDVLAMFIPISLLCSCSDTHIPGWHASSSPSLRAQSCLLWEALPDSNSPIKHSRCFRFRRCVRSLFSPPGREEGKPLPTPSLGEPHPSPSEVSLHMGATPPVICERAVSGTPDRPLDKLLSHTMKKSFTFQSFSIPVATRSAHLELNCL